MKHKPIRCRLGRHGWVTKYTADNEPYRICERCGAEDVWGEGRARGLPEVG